MVGDDQDQDSRKFEKLIDVVRQVVLGMAIPDCISICMLFM
jgi:hypothetical protein